MYQQQAAAAAAAAAAYPYAGYPLQMMLGMNPAMAMPFMLPQQSGVRLTRLCRLHARTCLLATLHARTCLFCLSVCLSVCLWLAYHDTSDRPSICLCVFLSVYLSQTVCMP